MVKIGNMKSIGLILSDVFETDKGKFFVSGIQFKGGLRIGPLLKPYDLRRDSSVDGKLFTDDEIDNQWHNIKYHHNE